jgi:serine/threonine protein kinase
MVERAAVPGSVRGRRHYSASAKARLPFVFSVLRTPYEMLEVEHRLYIVMEDMSRGSLRKFISRLTTAQQINVLQSVLSGLAYAHSQGVVHHDLKPENVLVASDGSVKTTNFGIARVTVSLVMDARGRLVGTPRYMAPELLRGDEAGPPADLYSVGIMAYEMFTGRTPFEDAKSAIQLMALRVQEDAPPPIAVNRDLDPSLSAWTEALLERDPANRPASATAASEAHEDFAVKSLGPSWRRRASICDAGTPCAATTEPPAAADDAATAIPPDELEAIRRASAQGGSAADETRPQDEPTHARSGAPIHGSADVTARETRTRVFVSYSHKDRKWLERLQVHMEPLVRQGTVDLWDDSHIRSGSDWRSEIRDALSSAQVAILLISADFLASDFIAEEELPRLLRAAEDDGALILPVIVSPSRFSDTALSRFQAINSPTAPLIAMKRQERELAFVRLTAAVQQALRSAP